MAKKKTKNFSKDLQEGLKYPWNKAGILWNILWMLIPIFGWFAIIGYVRNITVGLVKGKRKELPAFGKFWDNFLMGLKLFIYLIPTIIVLMVISAIPMVGSILQLLVAIFLLPWLMINLFVKDEFGALWELKKAFNMVFDNARDYILAYLKTLVFSLIYGIASMVLIGIPCSVFGKYYFLTEFYSKYH